MLQASEWRTGEVVNGAPGPVVSVKPWPDASVRYGVKASALLISGKCPAAT